MEKHVGSAKRSVIIKANVETVWKKLSKITKLDWLEEQKSSKFLSQKKYGVGAIILISFEDGSDVEEHVVEWSTKKGFSYIAITGLPLLAYLATISMKKTSSCRIKALEQGLYSTNLGIAGRVDCIAEYDKELTVIDFKTATRKRDEINENYLVQASFYSIAWEERTGEKVNQIAILTTTEDGKLDVYRDDPSNHVGRLEEMIEEYKTGKIG